MVSNNKVGGVIIEPDFSMGEKSLEELSEYTQVGADEITQILDGSKQTSNGYREVVLWFNDEKVIVREKNGNYDRGAHTKKYDNLEELIKELGDGELKYHQRVKK